MMDLCPVHCLIMFDMQYIRSDNYYCFFREDNIIASTSSQNKMRASNARVATARASLSCRAFLEQSDFSIFNSLLRLAGWLQRGEILDEVAQLGSREAGGKARRHHSATFGALLDVLRLHRSYFSGGKVADA